MVVPSVGAAHARHDTEENKKYAFEKKWSKSDRIIITPFVFCCPKSDAYEVDKDPHRQQ